MNLSDICLKRIHQEAFVKIRGIWHTTEQQLELIEHDYARIISTFQVSDYQTLLFRFMEAQFAYYAKLSVNGIQKRYHAKEIKKKRMVDELCDILDDGKLKLAHLELGFKRRKSGNHINVKFAEIPTADKERQIVGYELSFAPEYQSYFFWKKDPVFTKHKTVALWMPQPNLAWMIKEIVSGS